MAIDIPLNPVQLENKSLADLSRELPTSANPFLKESWMGAQAIANVRRVFDFFKQLAILVKEAIPITADEFLEMWASFWGITLNAATTASGNLVVTGTAGTLILQATTLQSSDGNSYAVNQDSTIASNAISAAITSTGTTATVTLASDTSMYDSLSVVVSGCVETAYNGTFDITVTDTDKFTYTLPTTASSPATGTPIVTIVSAVLSVTSTGTGQNQNQDANAKLSFTTPISGVNVSAYVDQGALGGGTDIETKPELRVRLLDRVQNPVAHFNVAEIKSKAKEVSGVTDVFVYEVTPALGQVTVYFIRGNDDNPIPDGSEVITVKNKILEIKPANTATADVIVSAPTSVPLTVTLTALSPNSATMQSSITENIKAMLLDSGVVGDPITLNQLIATIQNTIDNSTGLQVDTFTMTVPAGDTGGGTGQYVVFNTANYP